LSKEGTPFRKGRDLGPKGRGRCIEIRQVRGARDRFQETSDGVFAMIKRKEEDIDPDGPEFTAMEEKR